MTPLEMTMRNIRENLQAAISNKGVSQTAAARLAKVSESVLRQTFGDGSSSYPRLNTLFKLAEALDTTVADLMGATAQRSELAEDVMHRCVIDIIEIYTEDKLPLAPEEIASAAILHYREQLLNAESIGRIDRKQAAQNVVRISTYVRRSQDAS